MRSLVCPHAARPSSRPAAGESGAVAHLLLGGRAWSLMPSAANKNPTLRTLHRRDLRKDAPRGLGVQRPWPR